MVIFANYTGGMQAIAGCKVRIGSKIPFMSVTWMRNVSELLSRQPVAKSN